MRTKKTQHILTIIGITLLFFSVVSYFFGVRYDARQDICHVIEDSIDESYQSDGFEVTVKRGDKGYKVYLTLNDENNLFQYSSWCGCTGTDFLRSFKEEYADIDAQISEYFFDFLASPYSFLSGYESTAYTAQYSNGGEESSIYEIAIALSEGETEYESKTYLEYLKEWSTKEYSSSDNMQLSGEHYTVEINDDDSYTIEPNSAADLERNPNSTLMWYLDEYASQYFTLSNVEAEFTSDDSGNGIGIYFSVTNQMQSLWEYAKVFFYIYNEDGEVIDGIGGTTESLESGESGSYHISQVYTDETPADFRVICVICAVDSSYEMVVFE